MTQSLVQNGIFKGRTRIPYAYGCFGYTRGGGKTWHGGIDLVGMDDDTVYMPYYENDDGTQRAIRGTVIRARMVARSTGDRTWEWGWYVCAQLDANQTPDAVNFLYFCHNEKLLVKAGQKVVSGTPLAVMGNSGNAALNDPPYKHCHLEVRATSTGVGLDPTRYSGTKNAVGTYGTATLPAPEPAEPAEYSTIQLVTLAPLTDDEMRLTDALAAELGLPDDGRYKAVRVDDTHFAAAATMTTGDAMRFLALAQQQGWDKQGRYHARFVG